jgi:hypothetical protein
MVDILLIHCHDVMENASIRAAVIINKKIFFGIIQNQDFFLLFILSLLSIKHSIDRLCQRHSNHLSRPDSFAIGQLLAEVKQK